MSNFFTNMLLIAIISIASVLVFIEYTKKVCKPEIIYKYTPHTFTVEQENYPLPSLVFSKMFTDESIRTS